MKDEAQATNHWYENPIISPLIHQEILYWQAALEGVTAKFCLQIGGVKGFAEKVMPNLVGHYYIDNRPDTSIQSELIYLPIRPHSVDLILMPHSLESVTKPTLLIDQAALCLAPNGLLVISVLNRHSWFGLCRPYQAALRAIGSQHYFQAMKVVQWLSHANLTVEKQKGMGYRPPVSESVFYDVLKIFDIVGQMAWPQWSNSVLFLARKNRVGMTPVKAVSWNKKYALS
ncbi:MAG: hypothetical protein A3F17_02805 [Gammaproteobacteria bacterium RIFCSPHIGHO2_12_FULL_41_15]|nr:MAG: hypothetical protein A3F17_02805 [Gammaproteobacteria bacterium RIFCSPHIGHO2_12_FULL_41_15]